MHGDSKRKKPAPDDVSRRDFFKTVGAGSVATAVVAGIKDADAQGPAAIGPGEVPITLTINGRRHQLSVEPRVTLLDAIRTRLDITGQKRVCDRGACGACTVIIESATDAKSAGAGGRTYYSCSMLAIEAQGKNIRTVEGLSTGNTLHPVQQAFCDHDGLMCGFCTPGFVMSTVALLEKNPTPTAEEAKRALDGNLCRCGTNIGVLKAALSAKGVSRG
jgi:xanthine dehydrogenase YagT iron-sulfur-binding subunit